MNQIQVQQEPIAVAAEQDALWRGKPQVGALVIVPATEGRGFTVKVRSQAILA